MQGTSVEDLLELKGQLLKKEEKGDFDGVASILKVLGKYQITTELLRSTMIGKTINHLAGLAASELPNNSSQETVKELASSLMDTWKKIHRGEKKKASEPNKDPTPKLATPAVSSNDAEETKEA